MFGLWMYRSGDKMNIVTYVMLRIIRHILNVPVEFYDELVEHEREKAKKVFKNR